MMQFCDVEDYVVYPNPFNSQLTIEIESLKEAEYKVYSVIGKPLLTEVLKDGVNIIDLSSLPRKIYFLNIDNQSIKLVKTE